MGAILKCLGFRLRKMVNEKIGQKRTNKELKNTRKRNGQLFFGIGCNVLEVVR